MSLVLFCSAGIMHLLNKKSRVFLQLNPARDPLHGAGFSYHGIGILSKLTTLYGMSILALPVSALLSLVAYHNQRASPESGPRNKWHLFVMGRLWATASWKDVWKG
jgi:hypothetical protein